jgi:hypothetical protein
VVGVESKLYDAGVVAEIDEGKAAVVAGAVHPTGQADRLPDMRVS